MVRTPRAFGALSPWAVVSVVGGAVGAIGIRRAAVGTAHGVSWVVVGSSVGAAWRAPVPDACVVWPGTVAVGCGDIGAVAGAGSCDREILSAADFGPVGTVIPDGAGAVVEVDSSPRTPGRQARWRPHRPVGVRAGIGRGRGGRPRRRGADVRPACCAPPRRGRSKRCSAVWVAVFSRPAVTGMWRGRREPVWLPSRRTMTMGRVRSRRLRATRCGRRIRRAMSGLRIRFECRSRRPVRAAHEPGAGTGRAWSRRRVPDGGIPQAPLLSTSIASASTSMYFCRLSRVSCMISPSPQW